MEKLDSDRLISIIVDLEELDQILEEFEGEYCGMEDARVLISRIIRKQAQLLKRIERKENE